MKRSFQPVLSDDQNSDAQRRLRVSSVRKSERRTEHYQKFNEITVMRKIHRANDRVANEIGRIRTVEIDLVLSLCALNQQCEYFIEKPT